MKLSHRSRIVSLTGGEADIAKNQRKTKKIEKKWTKNLTKATLGKNTFRRRKWRGRGGFFPVVGSQEHDVTTESIHYVQSNQVIKSPNHRFAEVEENMKKFELDIKLHLKTLIKKLHLSKNSAKENCLRQGCRS